MTLEPDLNLRQYKIDKTESEDHNSNDAEDKNLEVRPLEDFKVDLSVDVEMPKTGFDFLDNW